MSAEDAYDILHSIAKISGTLKKLHLVKMTAEEKKEDTDAKEAAQHKSPFTFSKAEIPVGAEISFIKDPSKKAVVVDDRKVQYDGEIMTTTALARLLLKKPPKSDGIHGPQFFTYQGEKLGERRNRIESAKND